MSALPSSTTTFEEYLNEQLINCLNMQTNVIQNLAQYSQHISLQLIDIRNSVEILANRIITLQQQSQILSPIQMHLFPPPSNPLVFLQPTFRVPTPEIMTKQVPFSFSTISDQEPSRTAPFIFDSINSNDINHQDDEIVDENESDESIILFPAQVHLSPVEIKTGEEDDDILFCERAKLYRYDSSAKEMKERGIGEMKILQHKITNLCRILMRREQIYKICANHKITTQMELKSHQGSINTYLWSAIDFSDGVPKHETLCIKFKTDEQAKNFQNIFYKAKEINQNKTDNILSIENLLLNDDNDVIIIDEIKPTIEQIERAKKFQLPLTFYLYENKEPCKGCRGCKEDPSLILSNEIQFGNQRNSYDNTTTASIFDNLPTFPSGFFPNSALPTLMSMLPTYISDGVDSFSTFNIHPPPPPPPPKDHRTIVKAKRCLPSNRLPPPSLSPNSNHEQTSFGVNRGEDAAAAAQTYQKKSRNFSGTNIQSYSLDDYAAKITQNIMDQVKQELCRKIQIVTIKDEEDIISQYDNNKPSNVSNSMTSIFGNLASLNTNKTGFSFTGFNTTTIPEIEFQFSTPITSEITTIPSIFTFGNTPKLSFSDLAKESSDNKLITDDIEKRIFPGQGSLLFQNIEKDKDDNDNTDDIYEPSISFKPIVHLKPVEVKTGEEDENILFCERAKLYRYDSLAKEMKERGIGEMKILQHKITNLCRILMRREQIYKICANHKITSQMKLKEHQNKENAYIWSAMDFSDRELKHETLCIKFKTSDQAKRFFQQFNDAKQINANIEQ